LERTAPEADFMEESMQEESIWKALSEESAAAIEKAGRSIVAVHARRRIPASGIHWKQGIIVTADHGIDREEDITVSLPGGATAAATLAGRDATTDLAILRVENSQLPLPELDDSVALRPGNFVFTIGRTHEGSVRAGVTVVSVAGPAWRTWRGGTFDRTIRLERNLHPNFAGGAGADVQGRVLGMLTPAFSRFGAMLIPASTVERVAAELASKGHIGRGYLGVAMQTVRLPKKLRESLNIFGETAVMVMNVEPESPAEKAGVAIGDVFVSLQGQSVRDTDQLQQFLTGEQIGKSVKATIVRGGALKELAITVGERG
jgi:serine protease DegQ